MLSNDKRKHNTLTLKLKAEVIDKLNKGEKIASLANFYNVGRTTIYDIKKKSEKIERYVKLADKGASKRQTLKPGKNPEVEETLYAWFLEERDKDTHITAELMRQQAKLFYRQITNKVDFKASEGWLDKFKHRFGIRSLKATSDELAVVESSFVSTLSSHEQDESGSDTEVAVKIEKIDDEMLEVILTEEHSQGQHCSTGENCSSIDPEVALASFNTCIKWSEQNGVAAEDIIILLELRKKVYKIKSDFK